MQHQDAPTAQETHDSLMNTKIANDTPRHAQDMWQTQDMSRTPQRAPTPWYSVTLYDMAFVPQSPRCKAKQSKVKQCKGTQRKTRQSKSKSNKAKQHNATQGRLVKQETTEAL